MKCLCFAGALLAPALAYAQATPTRNIELSLFDPTPSTSTTASFQVQDADVGDDGAYAVTANLSYANKPLVLGTLQNDDPVVKHQTLLSIGGAYALKGLFEVGAHMPLYMQSGQQVSTSEFGVPPADGAAAGDLTLHGKARIYRSPAFRMAAALVAKVPTATDSDFTGTELPSARALLLASMPMTNAITVHANAGAVIRKAAQFANITQGSGAVWGVGISFRVLDPLFLTADAWGELIPSGYESEPVGDATMGTKSLLATAEGLLGARYIASRETTFGIATGRGIDGAIGTPELRVVAMFSYTPYARELPKLYVPPPPPPPADPNKEDTDYDRIVDAQDKCPNEREDKDGFEDTDGCPDPDNDKDNVPDDKDKCPNVAEDIDGFDDGDGCPDPDNDKDGIPDAQDKCPTKPEKINGVNDDDGCPDAGDSLIISNPERLDLLETVQFTGTQVSKRSFNLLGQLAATLRARADIARIRITVHVQPTKEPPKDQMLSDKRATAIREWLVKWGIAADRLDVRGFGGSKPLVPPTQKGAEQINDRIELIIVERK